MARAVTGDTALASTKTLRNPSVATLPASSSAACGGHTEMITSLADTSAASVCISVNDACAARCRVAAPRPADAHNTCAPPAAAAPIVTPI
jgi:hypothetical protein